MCMAGIYSQVESVQAVPTVLWNSPFVLHGATSIYKSPKYGIVLFFI